MEVGRARRKECEPCATTNRARMALYTHRDATIYAQIDPNLGWRGVLPKVAPAVTQRG